ncbi:MAG: TIGR03000 domain-containing protein [Gemmataceae bacterium]
MNRLFRIASSWIFLLSIVLALEARQPAWGADKKPVHLDVLLPDDAELEVNGYKTKSTGEKRMFESPPVEMGRTYEYSLKVSWREHTLTRHIQVQAEHPLTLDLRKELEALAKPKPAGSFVLLAPPALMLRADEKLSFPLRVKRFDLPDPIHITFENLPKGITVAEATLSDGKSECNAVLHAADNAPQGSHDIRVSAASGATKDVSTIKITIAKPEIKTASKPKKKTASAQATKFEPKPEMPLEQRVEQKPEVKPTKGSEKVNEPKPETKPPLKLEMKSEKNPSPGLRLLLPARVALHPGQSKYVEIKTTMDSGAPLPAEPVMTLTPSTEGSLNCVPWTIAEFKTDDAAQTMGFVLKASAQASPGERSVKVSASAGKLKGAGVIPVIVTPPEKKPVAEQRSASALQLTLPGEVELPAGQTKYVEVQVKTADGSPLAEEPRVTLAAAPDCRLRTVPWTSSFKRGESTASVGFAVKAEAEAPAGKCNMRIAAVAGNSKVEGAFQMIVKARDSGVR